MVAANMRVFAPAPGDIVYYNFDGGGMDHVGIIERVTSPSKFTAIEGNSGVRVARVNRMTSGAYFCRPRYDAEPEPPVESEQEDDEMVKIEQWQHGRFPAFLSGQKCYLDITDETEGGAGAQVKLFFRGDDGNDPPVSWAKTIVIAPKTTWRCEVGELWDIGSYHGVTVEVECLKGTVGVFRHQT
jgi:hypothetical protein